MGIRVLVTGDREWAYNDYKFIYRCLTNLDVIYGITDIIEGCARGVDRIAEWWAYDNGIDNPENHYPADWDNPAYISATGKKFAGNVRNQQMLDEGKPDLVAAFHKNLEKSRGTKDMVTKARNAGVPVEVFP